MKEMSESERRVDGRKLVNQEVRRMSKEKVGAATV